MNFPLAASDDSTFLRSLNVQTKKTKKKICNAAAAEFLYTLSPFFSLFKNPIVTLSNMIKTIMHFSLGSIYCHCATEFSCGSMDVSCMSVCMSVCVSKSEKVLCHDNSRLQQRPLAINVSQRFLPMRPFLSLRLHHIRTTASLLL